MNRAEYIITTQYTNTLSLRQYNGWMVVNKNQQRTLATVTQEELKKMSMNQEFK